jgi:YYY domain-containing protein
VVCLPFTLNFEQISTNLRLVEARTPLNQLIILWGLPIYVVICFIAALVSDHRKALKSAEEEVKKPILLTFFSSLTASDLFVLVLGLCAIGLVLLPELVYIQDIYSGDYKRANTMFKLTYQAFIMFGLCFGYILLRLLCYGRTKTQRRHAFLGMLLFLISLTYIQNAVHAWYGNTFHIEGKRGLDAAAFMETTMPEDALATSWLNEHISGMPVVLEANGDSYSDYQRVSVITGLPTVLGWHTHEWLWKSDSGIVDARAADIEAIYTSFKKEGEDGETYTSLQKDEILELLKKYDVSYIYVGILEQDKYSEINHGMLKSLGEVVFEIPAAVDGEYDTYIVKVNYE